MIYTGEFTSLDGKDYTVKITTSTGNQTRTVTLGGEPFVTEMDGSSDTIYEPAKYQSATVTVISPDYLFDVYTGKAQGTKVELLQGSRIMWTGYATPNLYDQGFVEEREEIEIECIDGLSTLQYIKYKSENKQVLSFGQIIYKILRQCNCYAAFYMSHNTKLSADSTGCILDQLYISEENFFKKKKDDETDDDVAWTCQDVLEEICRFLGVTMIAHHNAVYFVDYDSIKSGDAAYFRKLLNVAYQVNSGPPTSPNIAIEKHIVAADYADTGAKLSLTDVFNKVTVKDDLYTFDEISPDIFQDGKLVNITNDKELTVHVDQRFYIATELWQWNVGGDQWLDTFNEYMLDTGASGRKASKYYFVASQYFKHPNITPYIYKCNSTPVTAQRLTYPQKIGWDDVQQNYGCFIKKEFVQEVDKDKVDNLVNFTDEDFGHTETGETLIKRVTSEISKLSYNNYMMFNVIGNESAPYFYAGGKEKPTFNRVYDTEYKNFPMFDYNIPKAGVMFGGKFAYIILSGSFILSHNDYDAYNKGSFDWHKSYQSTMRAQWMYVYCRLKWGNRYWNGEEWTSTPADFRLYFGENEDKKTRELIYKDLKIRNNVVWWYGVNKEGYAIPVPEDEVLCEDIKFTMYTPMQQYDDAMNDDNQGDGRSYWIWLKNFKIDAILGNPYNDVDFDSDTKYTNIINENYVNEQSDISFKICTWDNKKPNYNAVVYKDSNGIYKYLDKTYNVALNDYETTAIDDFDGGLRQEEHLIYRLVRQYSEPCIKLNLTLHGENNPLRLYYTSSLQDKYFIADSINTNYKMNSQEITLIEKK